MNQPESIDPNEEPVYPIAEPVVESPATRRAAATPAPRAPRQIKLGDVVLYLATCGVLGGIGYVAWRTQHLGEPIDKVLPFLAAAPATPPEEATPADAGSTPAANTFRARPSGNDPASSAFGRKAERDRPDLRER